MLHNLAAHSPTPRHMRKPRAHDTVYNPHNTNTPHCSPAHAAQNQNG